MADKVIVIDSIADLHDKEGEIIGKEITDKAGNKTKIKGGQGGKLKKKWDELYIGRAYKLTMGEFKPEGSDKSFPFVADFEEVKNIMEKEAAETITKKMVDNRDRSIQRQVAVKLAVESSEVNSNLDDILTKAEKIYQWISQSSQ